MWAVSGLKIGRQASQKDYLIIWLFDWINEI